MRAADGSVTTPAGCINRHADWAVHGARERAAASWEARVLALAEPDADITKIAEQAACSLRQAIGCLDRAGWFIADNRCVSFGLMK